MVDVRISDIVSVINDEQLARNSRRIAVHLLAKNKRISKVYLESVNSLLKGVLTRYQKTWSSVRTSPQIMINTTQYLLDNLTLSLLSTLLSTAERYCKIRKGPNPLKLTFRDDTVLSELRRQRVILLKELKLYSSVESVKASIRHELNQVNKNYVKRGKLLQMQRERNFYDDLEMKPMGEQMKMIRFSKNANQRSGIKTLDHEKLEECSRYFASMFSPRDGLHYDQQTSTQAQQPHKFLESVW
jgi:hypothetical protein